MTRLLFRLGRMIGKREQSPQLLLLRLLLWKFILTREAILGRCGLMMFRLARTSKRGKQIGPRSRLSWRGEQVRPLSQKQFPCFPNQVMAEAMVCFLGDSLKSCFLVDVTRFQEDTVGPEHHFLVSTASSEADTLFN